MIRQIVAKTNDNKFSVLKIIYLPDGDIPKINKHFRFDGL